jgi:NAD/NADP transhydrogenase beta subunit
MAAGFSGQPNPLFYRDNTRMLFGNGKSTVQELAAEFKK